MGVVDDQRVDGSERIEGRADHPARRVGIAEVGFDMAEATRGSVERIERGAIERVDEDAPPLAEQASGDREPDPRGSPDAGHHSDPPLRCLVHPAPPRPQASRGQPGGAIRRVTDSPTKLGFGAPSTVIVNLVTACHQPPLELVEGDQLGGRGDLAVDRDRGREADLVPAVVDAEGEAGRLGQFFAEAVGQRQGQVAVGDRHAVGAFGLRPLRVDVDPLVVAGDLGEGVDQLLGDRARLARADLPPDDRLHSLDAIDLDSRHQSVHQSLRISPSLSWRAPTASREIPSGPASKERAISGEMRIASSSTISTISSSIFISPEPAITT